MNVKLKRMKELAGYAVALTRDEGLGVMLQRGTGFVKRRFFGKKARYLPKKQVLEAQRAEDTVDFPIISILVPVYNTPMNFLRELVESVQAQTCPNWELCLADASDEQHGEVGRSRGTERSERQ